MSWRLLKCGAYFGLLLTGPAMAQTFFTEVAEKTVAGQATKVRSTAFGDWDNDGRPDLVLIQDRTSPARIALYHNEGDGQFTYQAAAIPDELTAKWKGGSIFGDYDNDGDLDLLVSVGTYLADQAGRNILLRNDRGVFHDVALEAGLTDILPTDNALWLDYDRDGYLDLYTGNLACGADDPAAINRLYRNQGDGAFADVTQAAGLALSLHGGCGHGSNGGMAAGDFDDDGWPDLYVGVYGGPNRLFLNDGKGGFWDATTREVGDPGEAYGVAVGDIDNDGDLDLFQAAGGGSPQRSLMLLNLGQGQFLDVTEGVGLSGLFAKAVQGAVLGDIDNDGDLDLLIGDPRLLFINDGNGLFTDQTAQSGFHGLGFSLSLGDIDLDGFLDLAVNNFEAPLVWALYHNNGNDNHYLRVELVGTRSNRNGIGARLFATAGDLRQMREILGGLGAYQDELVAHFGLGQRTRVDRLEIRWPSGQVEVFTDIPADQKIRVLEGSRRYHRVEPARWQQASPETLVADTTPHLNLAVQPALFEPGAEITSVVADLSELGGPEAVPLQTTGDGTYRLESRSLAIEGPNGFRTLSVLIDQHTSLGPHWVRLVRQVVVVSGEDLVVFDEALAQGWQVEGNSKIKKLDLNETGVVQRGSLAGAFEGEAAFAPWNVTFKPPAPISPVGYTTLRFSFRPGEVVPPATARLTAALVPSKAVNLLDSAWVDLNRKEWQVVEIPMEAFEREGPIKSITFSGYFAGTFYLDDIRLAAATPPPSTVVEEERTAALPQSFALSQNFPNPFNSGTVIRFALSEDGQVELAVYNITGQQVAKLVQGTREAGTYTVRWDGRDAQERELASGVYLYRLRAGEKVETRKLALLR